MQSEKKILQCEILSNTWITNEHIKLSLLCPHIARGYQPGQFVMVRVSQSNDPLLRRPFAVYKVYGDVIDLVVKVVGKGTMILAQKPIGDRLDLIGPLGNGFPLSGDYQTAILVAGGIGIVGLMSIIQKIQGKRILAIIGGCSRVNLIGERDLADLGVNVWIATEDGSCGFKGLASELLEEVLSRESFTSCRIFSCGPMGMLKSVSDIAKRYELECYVSLEERMACGIGACLGCAVQVISDDGSAKYKMVCIDGPVFNSKDIVWGQ